MSPHRVHPPKTERFDIGSMTNTDPKGFIRRVDDFQLTASGLYLARPVIDHPEFAYLQSWFLPDPNIRITIWDRHDGIQASYDRYIDIVEIDQFPTYWRTVDLYLDITVRTGVGLGVLDTDELTEALVSGLITPERSHRALMAAFTVVEGVTRHGHNVERWLHAINRPITWRDRDSH